MSLSNHQELLEKYAQAIVRVGLNLRAGQRLIITNPTSRGLPPAGRSLMKVLFATYSSTAPFFVLSAAQLTPVPFSARGP